MRRAFVLGLLATTACNRFFGVDDIDPLGDAGPADATDATDARPPRPLAQRAYIKATNADAQDNFGAAIAMSADGSTLVIGAVGESSVTANAPDVDTISHAGAAYVFIRKDDGWTQVAMLKAPTPMMNFEFGWQVAIDGTGSHVVVGSRNETPNGAAYVFERSGTVWGEAMSLVPIGIGPTDGLGFAVAISDDGTTIAVGAPGEDSSSVGIGGDPFNNNAIDAGAVYTFKPSAGSWEQEAYLKADVVLPMSSHLGAQLALTGDGNVLVATAPDAYADTGAAYVFGRTAGAWHFDTKVVAVEPENGAHFGNTVAIASSGTTIAVGAAFENISQGAVHVFELASGTWTPSAYLVASTHDNFDFFGTGLSLDASGNTLLVGAFGESSTATGLDGNEADNAAMGAGAAYLFERTTSGFAQVHYIKAANTDANDFFGYTGAISADASSIAIGAMRESSATTNPNDNSAQFAGAAYVFGY